jgi:diacylglycerol kinase family enzyme
MPIDVIVNRNARRLRDGSSLREAIRRASIREGARLHETTDLGALETVAQGIARDRTDGVVLLGGDGSYMAGVSALARALGGALPPVGLGPGGTVGTIARNFGTGEDGRAGTETLLRAACAGKFRVEPKATLRLETPGSEDRVGFIFGAGLVARFFDEYYTATDPGLGTAAWIAARVFGGSFVGSPLARRVLGKARCTLEVDGVVQEGRGWSLVLASVVRDVGLHVLATYRAGEARDRFHVVASSLSPQALGLQAPRVVMGRPMGGDGRVDALAASLRVRFDEPASFVLDGELLRAQDLALTAGPALPLMVPLHSV